MTFDSSLLENIPHTVKYYPAKSTLQFFLKGDYICLYDILFRDESSEFTLETIEPTEVLVFCKDYIMEYFSSNPEFKEMVTKYIVEKMVDYGRRFLSMQIHTPEQRYAELVKNRPEIIQRIPQHYIASFLGITPVSLSCIRGRK